LLLLGGRRSWLPVSLSFFFAMGLVGTIQGSYEKELTTIILVFFFAPLLRDPPFQGCVREPRRSSDGLDIEKKGRRERKKAGDERDRALLPGRNRVEEAIAFPEVGLPDESVFDKRGKTWKSVRHSRVPISSPHYTLRFSPWMPMQTSCPTRGIWGGEDK
jgi:hypothetical protein